MMESADGIYRPELICATISTEEKLRRKKKKKAQISGREPFIFFSFMS